MNPLILIFTIFVFTFTVFAQKKAVRLESTEEKITVGQCLSLIQKAQEVRKAEFGLYTNKLGDLELGSEFAQSCEHQFKFDLSVQGENFRAVAKKGKSKIASIDNKKNLEQI